MEKKIVYLIVGVLFATSTLYAQNSISSGSSGNAPIEKRVIELKNESKSEEIVIHIKEQITILDIKVDGSISSGKLEVELLDPTGKEFGNFIVFANSSSNKGDLSKGNIVHVIEGPKSGDWIVKYTSEKATGTLKILTNTGGDYYIKVPESFSPTSDDDQLKLETYNIIEPISFRIYNKWGEVVFSTSSLNQGWDGKLNGEYLPSEAYVYYVKAKTSSGIEVSKTGDIHLKK